MNRVIRLAHEVLKDHPVNKRRVEEGLLPGNAIITRGAGMVPRELVRFSKMFGVRAYIVAEEATVLGAARILGIDGEIPPGATGNLDTDLNAILKAVLKAYDSGYDIVFIHIKGPDIAGHDANPWGKIQIIERVDTMLGDLLKNIDRERTIIALTADHTTPCTVRDHSGDPVPIAITSPGVRRDWVTSYDEISYMYGGLGRIRGPSFIRIVLDLMNRPLKWGE